MVYMGAEGDTGRAVGVRRGREAVNKASSLKQEPLQAAGAESTGDSLEPV